MFTKRLTQPSLAKNSFNRSQLLLFALVFAGIGGYFIYKSFAAGLPVPVPAANVNGVLVGNGFIEASARQVIRTAANKVYVITSDDDPCLSTTSPTSGVIHVWKGTGAQGANANVPTGFSEMDAANHPVAGGSGSCQFSGGSTSELFSPESRLDPSGIIHMAYIDGFSGNVYYQTFSTITDTWGSRSVVATGALTSSGSGWPRGGQLSLTLDANNVPNIMYMTSGSSNSVKYINKVGGTWSAPVTVFSGTNEMHPSMVTSLDGTLHAAWLDNSLATHSVIKYAHYSAGAWGTVETVSSGDAVVLANGDDDQGPSIATDSQNRPHVLYMDGTVNGSDDDVRMRYRTSGGVWTDNTPPGGAGGASNPAGTWYAHTPQNYISSVDDDWVFLGHDVNISPGGYQYQVGGPGNNWSAYSTIDPRNSTNTTAGAPGLDGSASIRWDPLRDNNPGIIDLIYYDENDGTAGYNHHATVYYKAVDISSMLSSDTTPPTVSVTAPTNGATVSGSSVTVSATASDNVGVSGVQFKLDGANLGAEDTSSPYSITWDSTTATNGSHSLTAVARDAAGNTTTSTTVTVTVSNTSDTTPPTVSVTAPTAGATVSGSTTVSATASDNVSVAGVQFKLDGVNLGTEDTVSPYSISWDTTTASNGAHTLTAVARDGAGNTTTSTGVNVTVSNAAPTVLLGTQTVNSHADSDSAGQAEAFKATAVGSGNASQIVLYVDTGNAATQISAGLYADNAGHPGSLLSQGSISSPTAAAWNTITIPSTSLTSGTNYWIAVLGTGGILHVRDVQGGGASETSSQAGLASLPASWTTGQVFTDGQLSAYVTSSGADTTAPSVPANLRTTSVGTTSISLAWDASTDTGGSGLAGYKLYRNGSLLTTLTGLTYTDSSLTAATSYSYTISAYDNAANESAQSSALAVTTSHQGDLNSDGSVNVIDLSILLSHYGAAGTASQGDVNNDGTVNVIDLSILLSNYGT